MNEHEDLVALSKRIAAQHGLTQQFQEKVLQQLRAAFSGK
jgi:DNA-binding IscR family transcriptional regulator